MIFMGTFSLSPSSLNPYFSCTCGLVVALALTFFPIQMGKCHPICLYSQSVFNLLHQPEFCWGLFISDRLVTELKQTFQRSPSVCGPQRCVLHYHAGGRQEIITLIIYKVPFLFWLACTWPSEASAFWRFFYSLFGFSINFNSKIPESTSRTGLSCCREAGAGKGQGTEREMCCWVAVTFSGY